jgi:hypothetical protein
VQVGVVRLERERLLERDDRPFLVVRLRLGDAEVGPPLRIVRLELGRLLEVLDGVFVILLLLVGEAERQLRLVVVGLEVERRLELSDPLVEPLEPRVGRPRLAWASASLGCSLTVFSYSPAARA